MKKYLIGFFLLVILTASVYVLLPDNIKISVEKTKTTFQVWENEWVLAGTERTILYDGTKKMRASSREIEYFIEGTKTKIVRTAYFKEDIVAKDTYLFDGNTSDLEMYPVEHNVEILNGQGKLFVYEVNDLEYFGETKNDITSPQSFGHNIKIEWESGNYYSKIFKYKNKDVGKLTVKYRVDEHYKKYSVRLFDPVQSEGSITVDGSYTVHTFTSNGTFNVSGDTLNVSILVVAGGGGGGNGVGAGGGAGGYIWKNAYDVLAGNYNVSVGIGGTRDTNGQNSSFSNVSMLLDARGGGGGAPYNNAGKNGGSGGGAGSSNVDGGNGTAGQGYDGGAGYPLDSWGAGGGGGCSEDGFDGNSTGGGAGGDGLSYTIYNGTALWYAGGGGGGGDTAGKDGGEGGIGGGGLGGDDLSEPGEFGVNGTGGGGGGSDGSAAGVGGLGGSGIVIIRYLTSDAVSPPNVTLDSPINNTNQTTNSVEFNCTVWSVSAVVNVSLMLDGVVNETNSTGINNSVYTFTKILSEGNTFWTCRGADDNSKFTTAEERLVSIDSIDPFIDISYPTSTNYTTNVTDLNYTIIETNQDKCWYSNDSGVTNSSTQTCMTNWTDVFSIEGYNTWTVFVNDTFGNENQSSVTFNKEIVINNIFLYFDNLENNLSIELNTTVNITFNATTLSSFPYLGLICIDIDHPDYGNNYTCSSGNVSTNFTINYFRKTTFWNDTTTWNFSDFTYNGTNYLTNETLNFTSHQYDEIDDLRINISSTDNVENVIFYGSNTSQIDRYYQGFLVGKNIYLNQSVDSGGTVFNNTNNITFNNPGNATVYFYLDDNATIVNITMNVSGASYGFSYFDEFDDFSNIDTTLSNAQLHYGPSGFIQAPNSSLSLRTFDTFGDASIANHWTYDSTDTDVTCDEGGDPSYSAGVRETGGYLESYAVLENDCVLGAGVTKTYNPNLTNLYYYTSDYISFSIHAYYDGEESTLSEKDCHGINTVKFSDNSIWSFSDGRFYNGHLVYDGSLDFELFKINQTYWRANISGVATETIAIIEDCDDTGGLTITYNYTNGTTFTNWADGDCTDTVVSLSNSSLQEIDISELVIDFSTNARTSEFTAGFTSCDSINTYLRLDNLKNKMWYRDNGTVISNSIFDSANNIASATFNYSSGGSSNANYTATQYLSADNGLHWEAVSNGVEKTFDYPGKHMKWKLVFNTTSPGYQNQSVYITNVTIATPNSNASNIEFDFGNDNTTDYTISGNFTSTNGTITISMASADISSALSSSNRRTNYGHLYKIPLRIYSATTGQINLDTYNITYDPNPVILNYTAIQDFLDDYGSNSTNFTIPIAGANGTVNVSSIQFDYAGGNSTINITVRDVLNTLTLTRYITAYYSRWDYEFVPLYVNWLEFIPKSSKALNVTPYGQTNSTAILNITNYGYGGKNANLSVYLNDTSSCVNLTLSTTWNKENGYQLNSSWRELQSNAIYLNTTNIWMWADYNCSYNNWTLFYPSFYFRQVCDGCTGSEELDY